MSQTKTYSKLDPTFKRKWVKALRSGKYKRATGDLCEMKSDGETPKGFCCLGVAAHIQGVPLKKLSGNGFLVGSAIKGYGKLIPKQIKGTNGLAEKLADMNDSKHGRFSRIANWIEKNL